MALTAAQQTDAYRFFSIAFDAAPGVEYMNQIADAYATGATTKQVVNAFVSKSQFTNAYPTFLTNEAFASNLVDNVVGTSASAAAITQAKADVVTALNGGLTRGDVIYTIFNNLANKPAGDAVWGATATMMANKVAVAQYYTEVLLSNTTDLGVLQAVLAGVTPTTDVSSPEAIARVIGSAANVPGKTFLLTAGADTTPMFAGGALNDVFVATNATLTAGDRLDGGAGNDSLIYSSDDGAAHNHGALFMTSVERLQTTLDNGSASTFDLSGATGLNAVAAVNSTGNATFNQVTSVPAGDFTIEADTVTNSANISVHFQDTKVAGATNEVLVKLLNNYNALTGTGIGTLQVGRTGDLNGGVETISVTTGEAASLVNQLDSDISRLNVAGDQNLTITTALNSTVDTVAAGSFTGALNINLTGNVAAAGEGALSITTGTGNDVIDLLNGTAASTVAEVTDMGTVTRNATISTGAGNDTVEAGLGDDNIDLGEGNDTLVMTTNGLTVADTINGGAGADTLILNAKDSITKSEAERVTHIETVDLRAAGSTFVVTDNLVNTADGGMFTVTTASATGGHTVDLTNLTFSNTNKFTLTGNVATSDTVIANDATVNAKAILNFGQNGNGAGLNQADADTLRIVDGGNYTFDDFANVTGLDVIHLTSSTNVAQTWDLQLAGSMIDNNDSSTPGSADLLDDLIVRVDRNVPQNSRVNIDSSQIGASQRVQVYTNSNTQVFVDGVLNGTGVTGRVQVLSSLEFTENSDNLIGTSGNDMFSADSLDQIDTADVAAGNAGTDTLTLGFGVFNANPGVGLFANLLNGANITSMENVVFDVNSNVSFRDDSTGLNGVTSYTLGNGNDDVTHNLNNRTVTYNLGGGNNTFRDNILTDGTGAVSIVNAGAGNDKVLTDNDSNDGGAKDNVGDTFNLGAGTDTLVLNLDLTATIGATVAGGSDYNLSGVDVIDFTATSVNGAGEGLIVQNSGVSQTDSGTLLTILANDANGAANGVAIVDASAVIGPRAVSVTMVTTAGAGQATDAADILGGSGNDTLSLGTSGVTGYAIQGNAGADTINISGAGVGGAMVRFASANDGGVQGANTGYDTITGFVSGEDEIGFTDVGIGSVFATPGAVGNAVMSIDAAVNFTTTQDVLRITQVGGGVTDAQLLDLAVIATKANVLGVTAAATDAGIIVVNGQTQSAIYLYVEQDGTANNVATSELKILGIVDTNALGAAVTDLQIV